ncbi:metal ABC transporter permease [Simkania negevensis]|uniref:Metal ABC transporter permease n=1 Tax=Simkania negevensis TaxID=83561 RepID=A0ABS3ARE1_9BACT|nr:metal ABC transporter permease [Simkania negevensis]
MFAYANPYYDTDFVKFLLLFFQRLVQFATGNIAYQDLASDEVQMLVLACVAASGALVGTFLILRRMAMLANSLSHTILLGIVIAYLLVHSSHPSGDNHFFLSVPAMLVAALITGIATTFITEFLSKTVKLQEDASNGLVFTTLFALGIVLITIYTKNAHIGTEVIMGNVDALQHGDLSLVLTIFLVNIVTITLFFKEFSSTTFDAPFARIVGISSLFFNYLLMILVSATSIGAFRSVGVLMILAFLTAPPLTARLFTHSLKTMLFLSVAIGVVASIVGVALSRHLLTQYNLTLSTGGITVCTLVVTYLAALLFSATKRFKEQRRGTRWAVRKI